MCIRFNYKKLNSGDLARILAIGNPHTFIAKPGEWTADFVYMYARYPATWFGFGYLDKGDGYYSSYVLEDPEKKTFMLFQANRWHHVCVAFSKETLRISYIKVNAFMFLLLLKSIIS